jgi:hypothetical protein
MKWRARIRFTARQKAELWERWKGGQCIGAIARTLGRRNKNGVYRVLASMAASCRRRAAELWQR